MTYVPAFPKPRRLTNEDYKRWVRRQPCVACGATSQAHHTVTKGAGGSDYRTLAVCWKHHAELHGRGQAWFEEEYMVDIQDEVIRLLESYIAGGRP